MNRIRTLAMVAAVAATTAGVSPAFARDNVSFSINVGPPPPRVEVVAASRSGYVWAPGYWNWNGHKHVWVKGHQMRERHGQRWVPDRWDQHDGRWRLEHGHWSH
jgi:WXXGXW repeat (2 copies)